MTLSTRKIESYKIFDEIANTYDFLNHFLSFGIDLYWRKKFLKNLPDGDALSVLDLATGTGDVPIVLTQEQRVKSVTGIDRSKEMIARGNFKIIKKNLSKKVSLEIGDGVDIPFPDNSFDLVTISFGIRNFPDPQKSLRNIYRVLKPNGRVLLVEWSDSFGGIGPKADTVVKKDKIMETFEKNGFHMDKEIEAGSHHYGLIYKKL